MDFIEKNSEMVPDAIVRIIGDTLGEFGLVRSNKSKRTAISDVKSELKQLIEELKNTESQYIRCVVPNLHKEKRIFDDQLVINQLNSSSTIAYAEFMTYASRVSIQGIIDFCSFNPHNGNNKKRTVSVCLSSIGIQQKDFRIGKEYVFLRMEEGPLSYILKSPNSVRKSKRFLIRLYWRKCIMVAHFLVQIRPKTRKFVGSKTSITG